MARLSKKQKEIAKKLESGKFYSISEAVGLVMGFAKAKFPESIDVAVNLGVDPRKSDQVVRGASVLPHGTGKVVRVAVFAQGAKADEAREAGADKVGFDDLAEEVKNGNIDFDVVVASPDAMRVLGKLGQVLGPRGLMPNPKTGTVTPDVATAVKKAKSGQVRFRTDKAGIIHCSVGKVGFTVEQIKENLEHLVKELRKLKPSSSKGSYLKKITLSSTMGPGLAVDLGSLDI